MTTCSESKELRCLGALRRARSQFFNRLVEHAHTGADVDDEDIDLLRSEHAYQIGEFYYLVREVQLAEPARIAAFLNQHNDDMRSLLGDRARLKQQGLVRQRIQEAIFTDVQITKVAENVREGKLRLDQSDLARILATVMSAETCRKTVVAMAKGGLLSRIKVGQVLIVSHGLLEDIFERHLAAVVDELTTAPA